MTSTLLFQNLETLPRLKQTHQWADYIELLALTSEDKSCSHGYLQNTEGENEELACDMDDVDFDEEMPPSEFDSNFDKENMHYSDRDEKLNRRWSDIKTCLHSRQLRFSDAWPFELKDDVLYSKIDSNNALHRLYIALLLSSALRYIIKTRHDDITASLEEIGYRIFCHLMPTTPKMWIVKPFGAHQRIANGYQGTLFNKITHLAVDLNAKLTAEKSEFDLRDTGDGGLDVVAWHSMGVDDKLGYIPVAFAQCGCSLEDIPHKQYEAHPINWDTKVFVQHPAACYYFAPHDLRKNSGHWDVHLGRVIMLDRMRILHLAKMYELPAKHVDWSHVDEAINTRRSLYA